MNSSFQKELMFYIALMCIVGARQYVKVYKKTAITQCITLTAELNAKTLEYRRLLQEYDRLAQPTRIKQILKHGKTGKSSDTIKKSDFKTNSTNHKI